MKLLTITSLRGLTIPHLRLTTMPQSVADIEARGWAIHRRSGQLFFESPPDEKGKRHLYERPVAEFGLDWELEDGEDLAGVTKYSSGDGEKKALKK